MSRKRITQADVARRAGVSQAAVSQILGGADGDGAAAFKESTRRRVVQAAEELGYAPSILARALRTSQTMTIGVILGWITDELALRVVRGIQEIARERGYQILVGDTEQQRAREAALMDQFAQYQVDGLIAVDSWFEPTRWQNDEVEQPVVFVNLRQDIAELNMVGSDHQRNGYEATRHLLDLGHRPVGYIGGPPDWDAATARQAGYRQALEEYGLMPDPALSVPGDWTMDGGRAAAHTLLDRVPELRAIFAANDHMAAGAIHAAHERGLAIPRDLALVGYDDRRFAHLLCPALTSLALPLNTMGQKAAHLLIDGLLATGRAFVPSIAIPGALEVRASCGARPEAGGGARPKIPAS